MAHFETDVAIVGAGPRGLFMVFEAGFMGYRSIVLDALPQVGGQLAALYPEKPIYDIPAHPSILAGELVEKLKVQAEAYAPHYLLGEPVLSLEGAPREFMLRTASHVVAAKVIILAGGGGVFTPRKPTQLTNLETFEDSCAVLYAVTNKKALAGKTVVLAGGGDSAVDWAVELASMCAHVHVVHRRTDFRAAAATVQQMMDLAAAGKITLHTPTQLHELVGENGILQRVILADNDEKLKEINAERVVCCFGMAPNAGPLGSWGLGWDKGKVPVDRATMGTSRKGVLCIGDLADYEGKVALILTGFAEAAVAAKTCMSIIEPERKFKVQYSTSKGVPAVGATGGAADAGAGVA